MSILIHGNGSPILGSINKLNGASAHDGFELLTNTSVTTGDVAAEITVTLSLHELFASLLKKDLEEDPEKSNLVQHIRAGVKNMDRIISTLLLFAKSSKPSRQQCDINQLLVYLIWRDSIQSTPDTIFKIV